MPSPKTRPATLEDVEQIAEVHVASWRSAYKGLVPDEALSVRTVEKRMAHWKESLEDTDNPERRLYVIEDDGGVVGFAFAGPSEDDDLDPSTSVEIHSLYLRPDRLRAGLGGELLDHVLEDFRTRGYRLATLYVLVGNDPARAFYLRRGWIEEPDVKDECLGDGTPALQVRFKLPLA